jgi:hypothetical protein
MPMPDDKVVAEIWKKIVDVQQHFNDLELQIRNFALALTGAFLALGGYAIKESVFVNIFGHSVSVASLIVLAASVPLLAFYFMDKYWYHRLLNGAVQAGIAAEGELTALGYNVSLGTQISAASPIENRLYGTKINQKDFFLFARRRMHSRHKMDVFYGILFASLVGIAAAVGAGVQQPSTTTGAPVDRPSVHPS